MTLKQNIHTSGSLCRKKSGFVKFHPEPVVVITRYDPTIHTTAINIAYLFLRMVNGAMVV
jgi:hypothetical protein